MRRPFSACNFHPRTELCLALIRSFARAHPGDADFQCLVLSQFGGNQNNLWRNKSDNKSKFKRGPVRITYLQTHFKLLVMKDILHIFTRMGEKKMTSVIKCVITRAFNFKQEKYLTKNELKFKSL
jgi:hypothetical protein